MKVTVVDVVSPSYFVATAAVELGFFRAEGLDAEFVRPSADTAQSLRDGDLAFMGTTASDTLTRAKDIKILCALSQYNYWFLGVRADLNARQGDLNVLKGLRISASPRPTITLKRLLTDAGLQLDHDNIRIVGDPPHDLNASRSRVGIEAIRTGLADAYWGNGMRMELGVREGIASVLVDIRRGDGPPAARQYTFPALVTSQRLIEQRPDAAAAAIRAVTRTQAALKSNPSLAAQAAQRWFPPEEAELISELIRRDAPFYDATISTDAITGANRMMQEAGLLTAPVPYDLIVASQFKHLWSQ
jgi:NitT/TauT family transport system substrate-binding protein